MIHERGYWQSMEEINTHLFDKPLCEALIEKYKGTVVDIGCGNGSYVFNFLNNGIKCKGFDGSPLTEKITYGICRIRDFSIPTDIGKYDLVLSLETGEHIPRQYEQTFIDNICNSAKNLIIISWAVEGQGGTGHFNERNNDYIIGEFAKRGFSFDTDQSEYLRIRSSLPWFVRTLMVFTRPKVMAIFFSCRRLHLLKQTVEAFIKSNTYPIEEIIIVNDSGDKEIHEQLKRDYSDFTLVLNEFNVGLMKSIDLGYSHVKTPYFYHSEDDWCNNDKGGFIEQSLAVMEANPLIENVWLANMNNHGFEPETLYAGKVPYYLVKENQNGWHGFATACGLKSLKAYKEVGLYSNIPTGNNIWEWERNIGEHYHKLGYRSAILLEEYIFNTGLDQSEYTGDKIF
jgi:hypothetical protein